MKKVKALDVRPSVITWLKEHGEIAEGIWNDGDSYTVDTIHGTLVVHAYDNWIACRFYDSLRAKRELQILRDQLNTYSGKWNFHFFDGTSNEEAFAEFKQHIEKILLPKPSSIFVNNLPQSVPGDLVKRGEGSHKLEVLFL